MAENTDKFCKLAPQWIGALSANISSTDTDIPLQSVDGLPTDTAVIATIDRVNSSGTKTPDRQETVVGVVDTQNSKLTNCIRNAEFGARPHDSGAVVEILVTAYGINRMIDGILAEHNQDGAHNWNGWMPANETWTYSSWNSSVYTGVLTVPSDATTKYSAGMRIKISQATGGTKYGIITAVASTSLTVFFGINYTLDNETISNPYYSTQKTPFGFPSDENSWLVETVVTLNSSYNSPTNGTWYNLSPSVNLTIPIGKWRVMYEAVISAENRPSSTDISVFSTLSTTTNSETDMGFTYCAVAGGPTGTWRVTVPAHREKNISLSSATTYYLLMKTTRDSVGALNLLGSVSSTIIRAVCNYL